MTARLRGVAVLVLVASLAVAGCAKPKPAAQPAATASGEPPLDLQPATAEQIRQVVASPGAKATLVNVWATWCAPCREEFPDLMRVRREYREWGLRLVLVSADVDTGLPEARRFLKEHGVGFLTYLKQGADMPFINGLDSLWSGALPATLLFDGSGRKLWFHEGKTSYDTLKSRIETVLAPPSNQTPQ